MQEWLQKERDRRKKSGRRNLKRDKVQKFRKNQSTKKKQPKRILIKIKTGASEMKQKE